MLHEVQFMQTKIAFAHSRRIGFALLVATATINGFTAPVVVDSFTGGSFWGNAPFRGQLVLLC
jgi:hypothetical protein